MLTLEEARTHLDDPALTDEEVEALRDASHRFVTLVVDALEALPDDALAALDDQVYSNDNH